MKRRLRLLVISQYYWPGAEATARLLTQLCEDLTAEFDVTVVTGCLRGRAVRRERVLRNGVVILRVASTTLDRRMLMARGANYVTFLMSALGVGLRSRRPDVVLCMTDPPLAANVAVPVARRHRVPLVVVVQDVFPDIAVQLGRLTQPVLVASLRRLIRFALTRADVVVAIGATMERRLELKGVPADRIVVIPNWADTAEISPTARDNDWALEHRLVDRFVVMHSGNVGYAQDLDTLVRATTLLRDLDDLEVSVVGTGARARALTELATRVEADAVRFYPYQPSELLSQSLSAADVHFVGLAQGLAGYVVPSRLYGIMAAARPVIVSADADSETAMLVSELGCGVVVPPGRVDLVARAIRDLRERRPDLDEMGRRGLEYVRGEATRRIAIERYRDLLTGLAAPG